ncbi:MAG: HAMP domain-containing histidine kinase [Elusimicrobia bacterium]|nr:HAMP domain-containing histidine kinase [Elusimicrobiota bacterium]
MPPEAFPQVVRREAKTTLPPSTFMVQLGFSKTILDESIASARRAMALQTLLIATCGMGLGLIGSFLLGRVLSRPVAELSRATTALASGDLDAAVPAGPADELGELGERFNAMAGRIRESIRSKEDLLSTLSHELKTPLSGLKGYIELMETPAGDSAAERSEALAVMSDTVRQMETSLGDALTLLASDSPPPLALTDLDLGEMVAEAVRLYGPAARSNGLKLLAPLGQGPMGPRVRVRADRELIRRVLSNLVSNALKYTPRGGAVAIQVSPGPEGAEIAVSDTGPGIAPENQELIFTKFYRAPQAAEPASQSGRTRVPGSGLGLAIAKAAVNRHNGRIWVESTVGKGSVFHVFLPHSQTA